MNVLFLTLLYPPQTLEKVTKASKVGLQNQINNYQWAFVEGIRQNLGSAEDVTILNALPVGVFPKKYKKLVLPSWRTNHFYEIGSLNLPWCKQEARRIKAAAQIVRWAKGHPGNRHVLLYSLYLPYMQAVAKAKKRFPDLKATVIITDLPNELGISSGRQGLLKRIEYAMGDQRIKLCKVFDGFVLLTEPMEEVLPIDGKPRLVIEGLIRLMPEEEPEKKKDADLQDGIAPDAADPVVLYTGTLNRELGVQELLLAFSQMPSCELWLCGKGDMEQEVQKAVAAHPNIRYFGFVSQKKALALQAKADVLINPRSSQGLFTRYSFPSKTLEYMDAGKPVVCFPLEGIPKEYAPYLMYAEGEGPGAIQAAVEKVLAMPKEEQHRLGKAAQSFVRAEKNAITQCRKLVAFLRSLP